MIIGTMLVAGALRTAPRWRKGTERAQDCMETVRVYFDPDLAPGALTGGSVIIILDLLLQQRKPTRTKTWQL